MRAELDREIGVPPPSTVDLDRIIARGRRHARLRRFVTAGGTAVLVVVVTVLLSAVYAVPGRHDAVQRGIGTPAPTTAAATTPGTSAVPSPAGAGSAVPGSGSPFPGLRGSAPAEPPQVIEARLSGMLRMLVGQLAPGATPLPAGAAEPLAVRHTYVEGKVNTDGSVVAPQDSYDASAVLADDTGHGTLSVSLSRLGGGRHWREECGPVAFGVTQACDVRTGPRGETVVAMTVGMSQPGAEPGGTTNMVYVTRSDGTGVALVADDGNEYGRYTPTRAAPVLGVEQLVTIGTDTRYTMYAG